MGIINLNHPAHFIGIGSLNISLGNFIVIVSMFAIFAIALFLPFPHSNHLKDSKQDSQTQKGEK